MQFIQFTGNLTRDPVKGITPSGTVSANFTVAVNRRKRPGEEEPLTDFFPCSVFGKRAEACSSCLRKGSRVLVNGELQPTIYEKENGDKYLFLNVFCNEVEFLSKKPESIADSANLNSDLYSEVTAEDIPLKESI